MIDLVKDWIYLYVFKHVWWAFLTLIISIVLPISIACSTSDNFTLNFLKFLGFTVDDGPKTGRVLATILIALVENVPQFCIIVCEMIAFRNSVMFIQAGNSLFALLMIYKVAAPMLGNFLEAIFKDAKQGLCRLIIFFIFFSLGCSALVAPQILV